MTLSSTPSEDFLRTAGRAAAEIHAHENGRATGFDIAELERILSLHVDKYLQQKTPDDQISIMGLVGDVLKDDDLIPAAALEFAVAKVSQSVSAAMLEAMQIGA